MRSRLLVVVGTLFVLSPSCSTSRQPHSPSSSGPHTPGTPLQSSDAAVAWKSGALDEATVLYQKACQDHGDCLNTLKALLAQDRFSEAKELAQGLCESEQAGACSIAARLNFYLSSDRALSAPLHAACERGELDACFTEGEFARTDKKRDLAVTAYQRACEGNYPGACFELGRELWRKKEKKNALAKIHQDCESGWRRACTWGDLLQRYYDRKFSIQRLRRDCAQGGLDQCYDEALMKSVEWKSIEPSEESLQKACDAGHLPSCWERFIDKNALKPVESTRAELSSLCERSWGAACRNLAELELRVAKKQVAIQLLKKACDLEDGLGCVRHFEFTREEKSKQTACSLEDTYYCEKIGGRALESTGPSAPPKTSPTLPVVTPATAIPATELPVTESLDETTEVPATESLE